MISRLRQKNPAFAAKLAETGKSSRLLAAETGLHPITISRILCKRQATTTQTAEKIAQALGCNPDDLGLEIYDRGRAER